MDDPSEWISDLLRRAWDDAVTSLRGDGKDITAVRQEVWPAHDRRSGGELTGRVLLKVYESGDQVHSRVTHGDRDKDVEQRYTVDLQGKDNGDQARHRVHQCVLVVVRALELFRRNPHPDWNEVADVSVVTVNNYGNYQQRVVNFTLRRYGQILPAATVPVDPAEQ